MDKRTKPTKIQLELYISSEDILEHSREIELFRSDKARPERICLVPGLNIVHAFQVSSDVPVLSITLEGLLIKVAHNAYDRRRLLAVLHNLKLASNDQLAGGQDY